MRAEIQMKSRENGIWDFLRVEDIQGTTLAEALRGFAGKEIVAEVDLDGTKNYFCGTKELCQVMARKGRSILCLAVTEELARLNPALLTVKVMSENVVGGLPEGSQIEKVVAVLPDPVEPKQGALF